MRVVLFLLIIIMVIFSVFVVSLRNSVYAVLSLIGVFTVGSVLLVFCGLDYLAFTFLIVYVGAVAVLFLFVVMLLNIRFFEAYAGGRTYVPFGLLITVFLFLGLYITIFSLVSNGLLCDYRADFVEWIIVLDDYFNISTVGILLYTYFVFYVVIIGLMLWLALVGAILILEYRL